MKEEILKVLLKHFKLQDYSREILELEKQNYKYSYLQSMFCFNNSTEIDFDNAMEALEKAGQTKTGPVIFDFFVGDQLDGNESR